MWKKGGGRFAGIPGKGAVATLMNGSVVFPRKTKVSRLDSSFLLDSSHPVVCVCLALCADLSMSSDSDAVVETSPESHT